MKKPGKREPTLIERSLPRGTRLSLEGVEVYLLAGADVAFDENELERLQKSIGRGTK